MAQAGLHIPASPDSALPVFEGVYADIGDEQSITQDLSTFSAHMARLRTVLTAADRSSLVLLDEIGAGTDPGEGAALGSAILEALASRGTHVVATTHLDGIKAFVAQNRGCRTQRWSSTLTECGRCINYILDSLVAALLLMLPAALASLRPLFSARGSLSGIPPQGFPPC